MSSFTKMAEEIMFVGGNLQVMLDKYSLELRKDKTFEDVKAAVKRGFKQGKFKTEWEIDFVSIALTKVLKEKK